MKRLLVISVLMQIVLGIFAMGIDNEAMTWAEYESKVEDAKYEDYLKLMEQGGQCFGDDTETVIELFQQNE